MLTLRPGSACDVCAEEYGLHRFPHCIPCGHVFCAQCCSTIVDKTPPRLLPACPFCREQFSNDSIRLIRLDFSFSGRNTPRRLPLLEASHEVQQETLARRAERLLVSDGPSKSHSEVRRLEDKVARVAATKTSVEEVSSLHKELDGWLMNAERDEQSRGLYLSALLLRAILMNHSAHSEATRGAKILENSLNAKIGELEETRKELEMELRRQRNLYAQKSQECQNLRTEVSRLKALATILPSSPVSESRSASASPTPPPTSPVAAQNPNQNFIHTQNPMTSTTSSTVTPTLMRAVPMHARSVSMSSRSMTPAPPSRTYTPAPSQLLARSQTPAVRSSQVLSTRSYTPAPPAPARMITPTPTLLRAQTPAPIRSRRLSVSHQISPAKMVRSTSEEKEMMHEIWIPPPDPDLADHGPPTSPSKGYNTKYASRPPSRMTTYSTLIHQQHRDAKPMSSTTLRSH